MKTDSYLERRTEKRLLCHCPIWFAGCLNKKLKQGNIIDISSKAASFTCYSFETHLLPGQKIIVNFSLPIYGLNESFALRDFTRSGCILSIDYINNALCRIVTQFAEILPFKPGEQKNTEEDFISLIKPLSEK